MSTEETPLQDTEQYGFPDEYQPESYTAYYADRYFSTEAMIDDLTGDPLENVQDDRELDELEEEVLE